ncbi:MAG: flagellar hook-associated protein FlgK [Negativicutes bacterium]|nr:flagellar hook-associated protein FlgK [Negativicutes bacterium]
MSSTFGTYNIAYSGMYVNQAGLATVTNNLANVSTTGASRVRVSATDTDVVQSGTSSVGTGTSIASITRARDQFLDGTYRTENADASYYNIKNGNLSYMQELLSEFDASGTSSTTDSSSSSDGVQSLLENFYNSWEELSKDPTSESCRESVVETADSLISGLQEIDSQLQQLQSDAVTGVKDGVDSLNDLAGQVADLNAQITKAESGGEEATYLRDQRDELLDQMSSLADISVVQQTDGTLQVYLGGTTLVDGNTADKLTVSGDGSTSSPLTVKWADTGTEAEIDSGSIAAYMEDADQAGYTTLAASALPYDFTAGSTSSITNLRQALNDLVTTLATDVNSLHASGYGEDGTTTGLAFFTAADSSQPLSITNIEVNPTLVSDVDLIAAAGTTSSGDNTVAEDIYNLSTSDNYEYNGLSMDSNDFYASVISWIGTAGDNAQSNYDTQTALVDQVNTTRQAVCSISTDEEMSNMIRYQQAYNASAKVMTTIDTMISSLLAAL